VNEMLASDTGVCLAGQRASRAVSVKADTTSGVASSPDGTQDRRRHWRGERKAVLVRVPVALADQLAHEAATRGTSVSDCAASILASALGEDSAA
jgi:hypothetical protein